MVIPPESVWEPIQQIRRRYDRRAPRWMPHITLLYPFAPLDCFSELTPVMLKVCRNFRPFSNRFAHVGYFPHNRTLWLRPEPLEPFLLLHKMLLAALPYFDDTAKHAGGFMPHLSLGQGSEQLCRNVQEAWELIEFDAKEVTLIRRNDPPDDVFRRVQSFPFG